MRRLAVIALVAALLVSGAPGTGWAAEEPVLGIDNPCPGPGGQGDTCTDGESCAGKTWATSCVEPEGGGPLDRACQIPCQRLEGGVLLDDPASCAIGETCVEGKVIPAGKGFFCQQVPFRVDLNLLDQAVVHHLDKLEPPLYEGDCSLEANLGALLDQNGDDVYDIFDLDLVVLAFLEQPGCDPETGECEAEGLVSCTSDDACGAGLHCAEDRHACQRDCGIIASREETFDALMRECTGPRKVCDLSRGRCEEIDVTQTVCQVDSQCPAGAYCLVGRCAPLCYSAVECPGTDWYCSQNNRCRALPHPTADDDFEFDPKGYAIRFARDELGLDAIQTSDRSALVVMDLVKKKQVIGQPAATFGYRLEVDYDVKQDMKCLQPFVDCQTADLVGETPEACEARQDDCYLDDTEAWIQLASPFGTVSAVGDPGMTVMLNPAAADALTPGTYTATVRAIFDNGDSDSIGVTLVKASPSGEYAGVLTVTHGGPNQQLNGTRPLQLAMRLKLTDEVKTWDQLMKDHNVPTEGAITDTTSGQVVRGQLHGSASLAFTLGGAETSADDEVSFVGIYAPSLGMIHLIGFIEVAADFCVAASGESCAVAGPEALVVRNLFGRTIRRRIELLGPFDEARALFHGAYAERISGMMPGDEDVTMEGAFRLAQVFADDTPLELPGPLLAASAVGTVEFPSTNALDTLIVNTVEEVCDAAAPEGPAAKGWFKDEAKFAEYLAQAKRSGAPTADSALGKTTILPNLRQYSELLEEALNALGEDPEGQQQHLNIYDFVSTQLLPCEEDDPDPAPVCIDEDAVRCGLALYSKALYYDWVDLDEVHGGEQTPIVGQQEPYCIDTLPLEGCPAEPGGATALFTLQEYNRFWRDLGQILKFDADRGRSDAFLVLFRDVENPFAEGAAITYKVERLRSAMRRYDALLEASVGTLATVVLHKWPALAFKQIGNDWADLLQVIADDRMNTLRELVDLERRVLAGTSDSDFVFAHHMMQQEYLIQVYLMALQARWQGDQFGYFGRASQVLETGQKVLHQLDPTRNVIGVQPGVVFFESSDPTASNWEHYRELLVGGGVDEGLIGDAQDNIDEAVANLKAALTDLDALEGALFESKLAMEATLAEVCGDPDPGDPSGQESDYCQYLLDSYVDYEAWEEVAECKLDPDGAGDCPANFEITCQDYGGVVDAGVNTCAQVVQTFLEDTGDINTTDEGQGLDDPLIGAPQCVLDKDQVWIDVHGAQRPCVGGQMGALLQERALVDLQRQQVIKKMDALVWELNAKVSQLDLQSELKQDLYDDVQSMKDTISDLKNVVAAGDWVTGAVKTYLDAIGCVVIAGLAFGTDCPQKAASNIGKAVAFSVWEAAKAFMEAEVRSLEKKIELALMEADIDQAALDGSLEILQLGLGVRDLVNEYSVLMQTSFNLGAQMEDLRFKAQFAADVYGQEVGFVADHLVGRETGYVLLGDALVLEASAKFQQELLQYAYRMVMAFSHSFNLTAAEESLLVNKVGAAVILDDILELVALLDSLAEEYCGKEAIDCDWQDPSNVQTLRFSLREQVFTSLTDEIDGKTGAVVTAGQKFHNTITQPPYLQRRVRGVMPADQVEVAFSLPVTALENAAGGPAWLIDPLECNQHLAAGEWEAVPPWQEGSVAVQVVGKNLGHGAEVVSYELVRGGIDYLRACHPESVIEELGTLPQLDYPIRKHLVSYAPQSVEANQSTVPSFWTRSASFDACLAETEQFPADELPCWKTFARDRALAAPDYTLVIPLYVGGAAADSAWITGEGLPEDERPVIEDIVLYFRYTARPIEEL